MKRTTIPGTLNLNALAMLTGNHAADFGHRAQRHRPRTAAAMHSEVIRLYRTGLSASDVAGALRLPLDQVVNVIAAAKPAPASSHTGGTP